MPKSRIKRWTSRSAAQNAATELRHSLNEQKMDILLQEIDNLKTLLVNVDDGIEPLDALTEQKQKVLDIFPVIPYGYKDPIHQLLSCEPMAFTEIPLDVIEKLIESGFSYKYPVNYDYMCYTCLSLAIKNEHYSAVRYLVQHGADCEIGSIERKHGEFEYRFNEYGNEYKLQSRPRHIQTPLAELALKANAPLDLFDVLATPQSLTNNGDNKHLPLHFVLRKGLKENALRLIKLGADVNLKDYTYTLPIELYERNIKEYHDDLYVRLIPSDKIEILRCVHRVIIMRDQMVQSKMIHRLLQSIKAAEHLHINFKIDPFFASYNLNMAATSTQSYTSSFRCSMPSLYVWSLMLVNLGWTFESIPYAIRISGCEDSVQLSHMIDDTWKTYRATGTVMSLQNMCIQSVRRCMRDFSDDSFMSLPVPNILRGLLMYQHVADIVCQAVTRMNANRWSTLFKPVFYSNPFD